MAKPLTARQRVNNGAKWLDANFPGWEDRININTLALNDPQRCICGQVFAKNARQSRSQNAFDGYSWAETTLFSEANDWITALVKMDPISRRSRASARKDDRATRVAIVLGFLEGYDPQVETMNQECPISHDDLQAEWTRLLHSRKRQRARATQSS